MATQQVICAGFGGQGVMSMGQLLTYAGMLEGKNVSWLPSYGPEMRGGTANCSVIVSDSPVGSPIVTDATAAIVMNLPSLLKFEKDLVKDGILLINSSLIDKKASRNDIRAYYVPANEIANEIGNSKVANMVMLGAFIELTKTVEVDSVIAALKKVFGPSKEHLIPMNQEALERGAAAVRA
ncbi:2-oxoacid:acceptor oxidoreductase family protein [Thermotalea metallivorans]|uniref:Pyruvate synthase subunit PorC n=1 Tax=Thermotalea metallivorans TaxID=520762 RepID=A0A140L3E9_9FIRM|nr:2-oxoacid:acceptor oxidoreductase family protein [Thermotalea metallivorans]KXG75074.1 Pyruvate synthase subunit PorC [Thermotalea metallivorans]